MTENEFKNIVLEEFKIELTDDIMNKLNIYSSFLMEYNSHTNLTAIKNKEDIYLKHFYDSLTLAKFIDMHEINSLCDVGTGAGFPGIVLKIVFKDLHLTLIDSNNKKIKFLDELIKKLNIEKISTVLTRSEEYALNNLDSFDLVTARAVTTLPALIELCLPLVKVNGLFVPLKGNASEEINISSSILTTLNGTVENTYNFSLPKENSTRTIIKIRKTASNPKGYPRSYDKIKKSLKKYIK